MSAKDTISAIFKTSKEKSAGKFYGRGKTSSLPLLRVEGVPEPLAMPLCASQAQELIGVAERAPFGLGEKTVVNREVRDGWRLKASMLEFGNMNPSWDKTLQSIVSEVREQLGISMQVQAQLYNLLLYEKGGKFVPHRDSEKCPGMFGTLAIILPSMHKGGKFVVSHAGEKVSLQCGSDQDAFVPKWIAFYADCEHELEEVTEGYRLSLVYNLVRVNEKLPLPRIPSLRGVVEKIDCAALEWAPNDPDKLFFFLDHMYTQEGLGWNALKGEDLVFAQAMQASKKFDLCLVIVKLTETGDDQIDFYDHRRGYYDDGDYGEPEIHDRMFEIEICIPDPENDAVCNMDHPDIDEDEFVQEDLFEGMEPDDEEHEGPTGNEGAPMTRWYTQAALVLWPKKNRMKLLGVIGAVSSLCQALKTVSDSGDNSEALCGYDDLKSLYEACVALNSWNGSLYGQVLDAMLEADGTPLEIVVDFIGNRLVGDNPQLASQFMRTLKQFKFEASIKDALVKFATRMAKKSSSTSAVAWEILAEMCGVSSLDGEKGGEKRSDEQLSRSTEPELHGLFQSMAKQMISCVSTRFDFSCSSQNMSSYSYHYSSAPSALMISQKAAFLACQVKTASLSILLLRHLKLGDDLEDELIKMITSNHARFSPLLVLPKVVLKLGRLRDVTGRFKTHIRPAFMNLIQDNITTLEPKPSVVAAQTPQASASASGCQKSDFETLGLNLDTEEVVLLIKVLSSFSEVQSCDKYASAMLSRPNVFPTHKSLIPAICEVTKDNRYRKAMLDDACWPQVLLKAFCIPASSTNTYSNYGRYGASSTTARSEMSIDLPLFVKLYQALALFDQSPSPTQSTAAATANTNSATSAEPVESSSSFSSPFSSISWRSKLIEVVLKQVGKQPRELGSIVKALFKELGGEQALSKDGNFQQLVRHTCSCTLPLAQVDIPPTLGWDLNVSLNRHCRSCIEVEQFFANPSLQSKEFHGSDFTWQGHVTLSLESYVKSTTSARGFVVQKLSTKAARVNGRLSITKTLTNRTPISEIPKLQQRREQLRSDKVLHKELQDISEAVGASAIKVQKERGVQSELPPSKKAKPSPPTITINDNDNDDVIVID